jgi:hypothetical protein
VVVRLNKDKQVVGENMLLSVVCTSVLMIFFLDYNMRRFQHAPFSLSMRTLIKNSIEFYILGEKISPK